MDLAFDEPAVFVGRVAKGDVDRPERLLRLGDVVAERAAGLSPIPISAELSRIWRRLDDPRSRSAVGRPRTQRPARHGTVIVMGPSSRQGRRRPAPRRRGRWTSPRPGGNETSPPGSAETSPAFRQIPVSQAIGSRPSTVETRSVPGGRGDPHDVVSAPQVGQPFRAPTDRLEVGRHGSIPPRIAAVWRIEVATYPGPLRDRLGRRVIERRARAHRARRRPRPSRRPPGPVARPRSASGARWSR